MAIEYETCFVGANLLLKRLISLSDGCSNHIVFGYHGPPILLGNLMTMFFLSTKRYTLILRFERVIRFLFQVDNFDDSKLNWISFDSISYSNKTSWAKIVSCGMKSEIPFAKFSLELFQSTVRQVISERKKKPHKKKSALTVERRRPRPYEAH